MHPEVRLGLGGFAAGYKGLRVAGRERIETQQVVGGHHAEALGSDKAGIQTPHMETEMTSTTNVIGPYSVWPRKPQRRWKKPALVASAVLSAAVFAHCILPMMIA